MTAILTHVSCEHVELVKRALEAWNNGDLDAVLAIQGPDMEWVPAEENPGAGNLVRGTEAIRSYLADWRDTVHGLHYEATEHVEAGDAVITLGTVTGHTADGPELTAALAFVTRFADGVPVRVEEYLDARRALEAAGLRQRR